ncbi:hypothetical protein Bbelb_256840 [Branchiostoma belcheri]|nr:hypothetical protein Bbelb_256840 [Branchiostoma belcheri]
MASSCRTIVLALLFFVGSSFLGSHTTVFGQEQTVTPKTTPENPTCVPLQNLFQTMQGSCARDIRPYANQPGRDGIYSVTVPRQRLNPGLDMEAMLVTVNWIQFTAYHTTIRELGPQDLQARVTYNLDGEPVMADASGLVPQVPSSTPLELVFPRPLAVQENQVLNITLHMRINEGPLIQQCSSCVGLNITLYQVSCNFQPKSFDYNGACLRAFSAWRNELEKQGGAGTCQDLQLDRQFLGRYGKCFVPPSIEYITSRVAGSVGEPARLVCITGGNPAPSVKWLRKRTLFTNSSGNTIIFDPLSPADTGKYVCVAEEREFFNRTIRANATLELQGQACEQYQVAHANFSRECAVSAAIVRQQGCGQFSVPFRNGTVTIDQIRVILRAEGDLPWVRPGEVAGVVNLTVTILQVENNPPSEVPARRRRRDTGAKTADNHVLLKRAKRQTLQDPQEEIIHQRVYQNVLALAAFGYEVSASITIEPVDVVPGKTLLIKVAEEGPNRPTVVNYVRLVSSHSSS